MRPLPAADEYAPFYAGYVQRVPDDPVHALAAQIELTKALLAPLSNERAQHRYAPDKWSVKEVVDSPDAA